MADNDRRLTRRKALEVAAGTALLGGIYSLSFIDENAPAKLALRSVRAEGADLAVVEGGAADYAAITERAIAEVGGIERYVKRGDRVVLSPNMGWMRTPDQAAATHPDVLRAVVQLCERAGASRITCIDYTLDDWQLAFDICGARDAVRGTRAALLSPTDVAGYRDIDLAASVPKVTTDGAPYASIHHGNQIYQKVPREIVDCDAFICIPIVKDHEAAGITVSMKKLMGAIWNRKDYHRYGLHECIAELNMALRPTLIVADATRALQTRGPKGPGEVTIPNKVVAGVDPVAVDAYCTRFLTVKGMTPDQVPHLVLANRLGRGEIDVDRLRVREIAGPRGS